MNQPTKKPATRMIVIVVLLVLVIALVAWLVFRPKTNTTTSIQITSSGFTPAQLTVKKGTTVTWDNTDAALHQIDSNPYPANNSLPGLASPGLVAGAHYSYTFKQVGTFGFHDQQNPTKLLGTIKVVQ